MVRDDDILLATIPPSRVGGNRRGPTYVDVKVKIGGSIVKFPGKVPVRVVPGHPRDGSAAGRAQADPCAGEAVVSKKYKVDRTSDLTRHGVHPAKRYEYGTPPPAFQAAYWPSEEGGEAFLVPKEVSLVGRSRGRSRENT